MVVKIGVDMEDFEADSGRVRRSERRLRRDRGGDLNDMVFDCWSSNGERI